MEEDLARLLRKEGVSAANMVRDIWQESQGGLRSVMRGQKAKSKAGRALATIGAIQAGYGIGRRVYDWNLERQAANKFTIILEDNDTSYSATLEVVSKNAINNVDDRRMSLYTREQYNRQKDGWDTVLRLRSGTGFDVTANFDGVICSCKIASPRANDPSMGRAKAADPDMDSEYQATIKSYGPQALFITCNSVEDRTKVLEFLNRETKTIFEQPHVAALYTPSSYNWESNRALSRRRPETIVLRDGQLEAIFKDYETFRDREGMYLDWGIPYHRGYLFYGPPGTGKTSVAGLLGITYELDVFSLSLSSVKDNAALAEHINKMASPRTRGGKTDKMILALEDIDVISSAQDRAHKKSEDKGVTLDGLLNALDGLATPHGMVLIMTTNNIDTLDEALIRAGRADFKVHFDYADASQVNRLVKVFTDIDLHLTRVRDRVTPADVVEQLKRHMGNPEAGAQAVRELVSAGGALRAV